MENWREHPDASSYGPLTSSQQLTVLEGFVKFMENVHHIKKPVTKRSRTLGRDTTRDRLDSSRITEKPEMLTKAVVSATSSSLEGTTSTQQQPQQQQQQGILSATSPGADIVSAMRASCTGLPFFSPPHPGLPHYCFLSVDAVQWLKEHVQEVTTHKAAMALLKRLCSEDFIRHASGSKRRTVHYGFFIYFVVTGNKEQDTTACSSTYTQQFHEVEIKPLDDGLSGSVSSIPTPTVVREAVGGSAGGKETTQVLPTFLRQDLPPLQPPFRSTAGLYFTYFSHRYILI